MIHPTAIIDPSAELHDSAQVGPYTVIEGNVTVAEGCVIESGVRLYAGTRLGRHNRVHHGAVIGALPQDLGFDPATPTTCEIGDHNTFREYVSVHRGCKEGETRIGDHNYFMAHAHVAHDCRLGDHNVFANNATLAGHVRVDHHAFLSGHTAIHQFCRIGAYVMVAGVSGVPQDVPPYVTVDGHRAEIVGLNVVGLRRGGFGQAQRSAIKAAYKLLYRSGLKQEIAIEQLREADPGPEVLAIIEFVQGSMRGLVSHR